MKTIVQAIRNRRIGQKLAAMTAIGLVGAVVLAVVGIGALSNVRGGLRA